MRNPWQLKYLWWFLTMTIIIYIVVRHLRQSFSPLISCRFPLVSFSGESMLYDAQIMLDVSQNAGDAFQVFEDFHTLCVGIIMYLKWTANSLCKSPAKNAFVSLMFLFDQLFIIVWFCKKRSFHVCSDFFYIGCWPHFVLGLLKTLWNKVGILDCS